MDNDAVWQAIRQAMAQADRALAMPPSDQQIAHVVAQAIRSVEKAQALVDAHSEDARLLAEYRRTLKRYWRLHRLSEYAITGAKQSRAPVGTGTFAAHVAGCHKCQSTLERDHHLSDEGGGDLIGLCAEGRRLRMAGR
jgi:hypothetical protein